MGSVNVSKQYSLFVLKDAKIKYDAEFVGEDQFLQKGAQMPIFCHLGHNWALNMFWSILAKLNMIWNYFLHEKVEVHPSYMYVLLIFQPNIAMWGPMCLGKTSDKVFNFFFTSPLHYCCKMSNSSYLFPGSWKRNYICLDLPRHLTSTQLRTFKLTITL